MAREATRGPLRNPTRSSAPSTECLVRFTVLFSSPHLYCAEQTPLLSPILYLICVYRSGACVSCHCYHTRLSKILKSAPTFDPACRMAVESKRCGARGQTTHLVRGMLHAFPKFERLGGNLMKIMTDVNTQVMSTFLDTCGPDGEST